MLCTQKCTNTKKEPREVPTLLTIKPNPRTEDGTRTRDPNKDDGALTN